jgi:DNA-binding NarL/FixJ family response regulator
VKSVVLVSAIAGAASRGAPMSPEMATDLPPLLRARAAEAAAAPSTGELSAREREVLKLLVAGQGNVEIAGALSISPKTVEYYVSDILEKLGAENRVQAAVYATRCGIV